jgi:myosin heavy subunit
MREQWDQNKKDLYEQLD